MADRVRWWEKNLPRPLNPSSPEDVKFAEKLIAPKPDPPLRPSRRMVCTEQGCELVSEGDH